MDVALRLIRKAIALRAPLPINIRIYRWLARTAVLEFAWHMALGAFGAIGILRRSGATGSRPGRLAAWALGVFGAVELWFAREANRSAAEIRHVLEDLDPGHDAETPFPRSHILIPPLMLFARGVRHERGVAYHELESGRRLKLDVYLPEREPEPDEKRPAIIQVHGGGWVVGTRSEQGIPLLNHLASNGWVGFNIDYRLSPGATFPDHIVDVKRAIAWVRANAERYSIDPDMICITGGSAGGHLAALAGVTANRPEFQPGFEDADTSVAAAVPFYGVYDLIDEQEVYYPELGKWVFERIVFKQPLSEARDLYELASPSYQVHEKAPPFLVIHGEWDTLVPVQDARNFVEKLRAVSPEPVIYVELPKSEHAFDVMPTVRTARMVETIERFLHSVRERQVTESDESPVPASA